jgi:hypothetical protein
MFPNVIYPNQNHQHFLHLNHQTPTSLLMSANSTHPSANIFQTNSLLMPSNLASSIVSSKIASAQQQQIKTESKSSNSKKQASLNGMNQLNSSLDSNPFLSSLANLNEVRTALFVEMLNSQNGSKNLRNLYPQPQNAPNSSSSPIEFLANQTDSIRSTYNSALLNNYLSTYLNTLNQQNQVPSQNALSNSFNNSLIYLDKVIIVFKFHKCA